MNDKERETKKYIDAVNLLTELEGKEKYGLGAKEVKALEPRDLYDCLQDDWWREWNGLTQEWINPK